MLLLAFPPFARRYPFQSSLHEPPLPPSWDVAYAGCVKKSGWKHGAQMPEILFELRHMSKHSLQRVISGCGGQPDFSRLHPATRFSFGSFSFDGQKKSTMGHTCKLVK